jgi:arylsulfatase A-like enzyme
MVLRRGLLAASLLLGACSGPSDIEAPVASRTALVPLETCPGDRVLAPPAAAPPEDATDLVLITVETWRPDRLGLYGAPRDTDPWLREFAEGSIVFDRAVAPSPWTWPTLASLAAGVHPASHRAETPSSPLCSAATTLAEVLREGGWRTLMLGTNPYLELHGEGIFQGFEYACSSPFEGGLEPIRQALQAAAQVPAEEPLFLWVHLFDPHCPYTPGDDARAAVTKVPGPPRGVPDGVTLPEFGDALAGHNRCHWLPPNQGDDEGASDPSLIRDRGAYLDAYDAELRETDRLLRRLAEGLQAAGRWEDAWVVLTGDHGEEFAEHGALGHGRQLYRESTWVPLVVKPPVRRGEPAAPTHRVEAPVSLVDLPRTLAGLLGRPVPSGWQGRDLAPALAGGTLPSVAVLSETRYEGRGFLLEDGGRRLVTSDQRGAAWFQASSDPMDLDPRPAAAEGGSEEGRALYARLREVAAAAAADPVCEGAAVTLDAAAAERLRALGYVIGP